MATQWNIDPMHSEIGFKVKHMMITNVNGSFGRFRSNATTEGEDFNGAQFSFEAEVDSIHTGVGDRDAHLKSEDFFNAEEFPLIGFRSTHVEVQGDELKIDGEITIRDVTKPITLTGEFGGIVVDPYGQTKAGLSVTGKVKRSEFGLKWSALTEAGGVVVGDEIKIHNEMQFVKQ
jgi:polyisoprenoid-binding protein YceI